MIWNDRIKALRKASGYTLKEIASKLGVTEATAQRYESPKGIKNIPYEVLVKYASVLSTSPEYLMGWSNNPKEHGTVPDMMFDPDYMLTDEEMSALIEVTAANGTDRRVLEAYRKADPAIQEAVRRVLGVSDK